MLEHVGLRLVPHQTELPVPFPCSAPSFSPRGTERGPSFPLQGVALAPSSSRPVTRPSASPDQPRPLLVRCVWRLPLLTGGTGTARAGPGLRPPPLTLSLLPEVDSDTAAEAILVKPEPDQATRPSGTGRPQTGGGAVPLGSREQCGHLDPQGRATCDELATWYGLFIKLAKRYGSLLAASCSWMYLQNNQISKFGDGACATQLAVEAALVSGSAEGRAKESGGGWQCSCRLSPKTPMPQAPARGGTTVNLSAQNRFVHRWVLGRNLFCKTQNPEQPQERKINGEK